MNQTTAANRTVPGLLTLVILGATAATGCSTEEGPQPGPLQVGVATVRMPVPLGIGTAGYAGFSLAGHPSPFAKMYPATKRIHGHPEFKAAVVSRGPGFEAVFLRADLVAVYQQLRRAVVLELEKRLGRDMDDVLIFGATHTHSGPGRMVNGSGIYDLLADSFFPEFYEQMVDAAADAVELAYKNMKPGRIGHLVADASEAQSDRRCQDGSDHVNGTLPLLALERGGKIEAVVFSYAMHGTVLDIDDLTLSQDVLGAIEQAVEDRFDHPVEALLFNSWAADLTSTTPTTVTERAGVDQPGGYDKMEHVAAAVAQAVDKQLGKITWQSDPQVSLRTYRFPIDREAIGYATGVFPYPYGGVYCGQASKSDCDPKTTIPTLDRTCIPFNKQYPAPSQTLVTTGRVGGLHVLTFPGEPGTRLGEAIVDGMTKLVGKAQVIFMGYTQDYTGYSLLEQDWWQGGYEAGGSLWGPKQGSYLRDRALELVALDGAAQDKTLEPLSPFDVPTYAPLQPAAAKNFGNVLAQVKASYSATETVVFSVAGGDPWLGAPVATLQTPDGSPVQRASGSPVESDGYAFYVDLVPTPSYKDDLKAKSRQFAWSFSMPARHKFDIGLPTLKGKYRLQVKLPTTNGSSKLITSSAFAVTD
jgi:Neutral/alkaline non-lysosomal ceramidase, N-terminal